MPTDFSNLLKTGLNTGNVEPEKESLNSLEVAARGIGQGSGMGFGDEAEAGIKSLLNKSKYDEELLKARQLNEQASQENPLLYYGSEIGSDLALGALTGGVSKLGTVGKIAMNPITLGTLTGVGLSDSDKLSTETAKSALLGGAMGGAGELASQAIGKGINKLSSKAENIIPDKDEIIGFMTGKSKEGIKAGRENLSGLNKLDDIGSVEDIKQKVTKTISSNLEQNKYLQKGMELNKKGIDILEKSNKEIDIQPMIQKMDEKIIELKNKNRLFKSDVNDEAINILQKKRNELYRNTENLLEENTLNKIPAKDIKNILQNIDKDVVEKYGGYGNPHSNSEVGDVLKKLRFNLDDEIKKQIPEYAKVMKQTAPYFQMSEYLVKKFIDKQGNVKNDIVQSAIDSALKSKKNFAKDKEINFMANYLRRNKAEPLEGYKNLRKVTNDLETKKMFDSQINQGSNVVNTLGTLGAGTIGGGLGIVGSEDSSTGGMIGAGLGVLGGRYMEKNAGKVAKKLIDYTNPSTSQNILNSTKGTKYYGVLKDSLNRGSKNLAVNHFLLSQKDPKYQELQKQKQEGK